MSEHIDCEHCAGLGYDDETNEWCEECDGNGAFCADCGNPLSLCDCEEKFCGS